MKKILPFLCAGVLLSGLCAAFAACGDPTPPELPDPPEEPIVLTDPSKYDGYYMVDEQKIVLTKNNDKSYILFRDSDMQAVTEKMAGIGAEMEVNLLFIESYENPDEYFKNCSYAIVSAGYDNIVDKIPELIYATTFYNGPMGEEIGIACELAVILKNEDDVTKLKQIAEDNKLLFIGKDKILKQYLFLACTKESTGNALQIANWFHEMDMFESASCDIIIPIDPNN